MATDPARASSEWLSMREPADAAARSAALVEEIRPWLATGVGTQIRDLGCGTGSMARWLAPRLTGPQHWVLYDRDAELLSLAAANPPVEAGDGAPVTVETRRRDITRLDPGELSGAALITASALLDMMTAQQLRRLVTSCARAGCAVLITLTVTGQVDLTPADPLDQRVTAAFNAHQRRMTGAGRLLGPAAVDAAVDGLARLGLDVVVRPSPWRLGPGQITLAVKWFTEWLSAARAQRPGLSAVARSYVRRRLTEAADGQLSITVHHQDLLARPR